MKHYVNAINNYTNFSGRTDRPGFWYFILFNAIFSIAAMVLDKLLGTAFILPGETSSYMSYGFIYAAYGLFILIPSLSIWVRRLHDVGKSGWFLFIVLIPVIGAIWLLVLVLKDSQPGENKWGPNPKGINLNY